MKTDRSLIHAIPGRAGAYRDLIMLGVLSSSSSDLDSRLCISYGQQLIVC